LHATDRRWGKQNSDPFLAARPQLAIRNGRAFLCVSGVGESSPPHSRLAFCSRCPAYRCQKNALYPGNNLPFARRCWPTDNALRSSATNLLLFCGVFVICFQLSSAHWRPPYIFWKVRYIMSLTVDCVWSSVFIFV